MYKVTVGNMLHLYGRFGQKADYAVRLSVRMTEEVDNSRRKAATFVVSYVGKWRFPALGQHKREFWTHVPYPKGIIAQIAAVNGKIFMSLSQTYVEDFIVEAFLQELENNDIPYVVRRMKDNDDAHVPEPV